MNQDRKGYRSRRSGPWVRGFAAAILYFVCAVIWFATTERIAERVTPDPDRQHLIKGLTGLFFVIASALLVSLMVRRGIIKHQRAQTAVRESEDRFRVNADNAPVLMWMSESPSSRFTWVNRQWLDFVGRTMEGVLKEGWKADIPKPDLDRLEAQFTAADKSSVAFQIEHRLRRHDNEYRYVVNAAAPRFRDGKCIGFVGSCIDITERKQAEEKLRMQLARLDLLNRITRAIGERQDLPSIFQVVLRSLEEHLPVDFGCICQCDPTRESVSVSSVGPRSMDISALVNMKPNTRFDIRQNGLGRCLMGHLVYEPNLATVEVPLTRRLAQSGFCSLVIAPMLVESSVLGVLIVCGRAVNRFSSTDCEFLRQLSEHVGLAAHQSELHGALQEAYNELRQTQQATLQHERLRALGQMASGIAHDINNALSPVALYADHLLETESGLSRSGREQMETISRAVDDVAATVARLREFYRQREPQLTLTCVSLAPVVQQVVDLTRARWRDMLQESGSVINLKLDLADDLPAIMGVESEIREALTNLVLNAVDAMPHGGTLTLRTSSHTDGAVADGKLPKRLFVEVSDTGIGMDEEARRRCLEPFYTTKGERGTGLGLASVYGVVQRHGGDIVIESEPGKGTSVRLIFSEAELGGPAAGQLTPVRSVRSRLRILAIDDDPILLKSLRDILEADGHLVTAAANGQEGVNVIEVAASKDEIFDAVITDLGMPYLDGRKVASAVKATFPATPVILLTGWGQRLMAEDDIPPGVDVVLGKPPKVREIRDALAKCVYCDFD